MKLINKSRSSIHLLVIIILSLKCIFALDWRLLNIHENLARSVKLITWIFFLFGKAKKKSNYMFIWMYATDNWVISPRNLSSESEHWMTFKRKWWFFLLNSAILQSQINKVLFKSSSKWNFLLCWIAKWNNETSNNGIIVTHINNNNSVYWMKEEEKRKNKITIDDETRWK